MLEYVSVTVCSSVIIKINTSDNKVSPEEKHVLMADQYFLA